MIFTEESIKAIIENRKSQTRRIVKDKINDNEYPEWDENKKIIKVHHQSQSPITKGKFIGRTKWQVGKIYSVQAGRGKSVITYCRFCKKTWNESHALNNTDFTGHPIEPLRIRITEIRKARLEDISNNDAKSEGFLDEAHFMVAFCDINKIKYNKTPLTGAEETYIIEPLQNPEVWVISFSRVD